jgi:hypothetical protein
MTRRGKRSNSRSTKSSSIEQYRRSTVCEGDFTDGFFGGGFGLLFFCPKEPIMAQRPVRVRAKDITQGKTFWLVHAHIQTVHHSSFVAERMQRYPSDPKRWYSDDEWARASIDDPTRIFIESNETVRFHRGWMTHGSPLSAIFFKPHDAQMYWARMASIINEKKALLEARFPVNLNPPKRWEGEVIIARVDVAMHDANEEERLAIQQQFKLNHQ